MSHTEIKQQMVDSFRSVFTHQTKKNEQPHRHCNLDYININK